MSESGNLLIMKFGGTSMGSAERMRVAAHIVQEEQAKRPVVVVVSAMSKITDLLLDSMRYAEAGNRAAVDANLANLRSRHEETCSDLLPPECQASVTARIAELLTHLDRSATGLPIVAHRPPRLLHEGVAAGEWLSATLFAE